jgi:hypothetical protein
MKAQLFVLAIATSICFFAQASPPAMAQAGSTGGTVGKQDKSVSGGEEPTAPESQTHRSVSAPASGRSMPAGIRVTSATLGENCGALRGNVTGKVAAICNGKQNCSLPGSQVNHPEVAGFCAKTFAAEWQCGGASHSNAVPASSFETIVLTLSCN